MIGSDVNLWRFVSDTKILIVSSLLLLMSCDLERVSEPNGRYQAVSSPPGIYIVDTSLGHARYCVFHEGKNPINIFTGEEVDPNSPFADIVADGASPSPSRLSCHDESESSLSPASRAFLKAAQKKNETD